MHIDLLIKLCQIANKHVSKCLTIFQHSKITTQTEHLWDEVKQEAHNMDEVLYDSSKSAWTNVPAGHL